MNIKYIVVEEKGMVKATAVTTSEYPEGVNPDVAKALIKEYGISKKSLTMPAVLTGSARTSEGDVFDEKIGKDIARDRLIMKYNKHLFRVLSTYTAGLKKMNATASQAMLNSTKKVMNASSRLESL